MGKSTTKEFINRSIKIHHDSYNYDSVEYNGIFKKVKIYCNSCNEYFDQRPSDHLEGCGCLKCKHHRSGKTKILKHSISFFEKIKQIHGDLYDYSESIYNNAIDNIKIKCNRCGKIFYQSPSSHLKGAGCIECNRYKSNTEEFIIRAKIVHGDMYDYSEVNYTKAHDFINIICNTCGEKFRQKAYSHTQGIGCRNHSSGYSRTQWINFCNRKSSYEPKVYIIRCFNESEEFIKIGITTGTVHNRFRKYKKQLPYSYEIINEIRGSSDFVWDKEKELHKLCNSFKYKPLISFAGETECFKLECLLLLEL